MKEYDGLWEDGEREGLGMLTYVNNDKIEGGFRRGQPHGVVQYHFASTGPSRPARTRYALYHQGERRQWLDNNIERAKGKILKAMQWAVQADAEKTLLAENL